MKLDREFIREIHKVTTNDGTRLSRVAVKTRIRECETEMNIRHIPDELDNICKTYGRAILCICIAQTVAAEYFEDRHTKRVCDWTRAILAECKTPLGDAGVYDDRIHPTRKDAYAERYMRFTIEED